MAVPAEVSREVRIGVREGFELKGYLGVPPSAMAVVLVTHRRDEGGQGASENFIAEALQAAGLATLLMDLLEPVQKRSQARGHRPEVDVETLAHRLVSATEWLVQDSDTQPLNIGYFGSDLGAAAALIGAARAPDYVDAVVCVGGRPDLAIAELPRIRAATLLVTGDADPDLVELHHRAFEQLRTERSLETLPGASQLIDDPSALPTIAELTVGWFVRHLTAHLHSSPA